MAALDQGQPVRLSDDFFIEARKANPPEVRITKPGRDYRASPIEEVTVGVSAGRRVRPERPDSALLRQWRARENRQHAEAERLKQADGSTTIPLEDFKLVPGDLVSLYATAKDAHSEARTDMFFIQADPFEREFSQSQAAGGGGGGGGGMRQGDQEQISQREKEIIAATWKQQGRQNPRRRKQAAEAAKFLSGVQSKLRDQALSLSGRLERRELTEDNQEFSDFRRT